MPPLLPLPLRPTPQPLLLPLPSPVAVAEADRRPSPAATACPLRWRRVSTALLPPPEAVVEAEEAVADQMEVVAVAAAGLNTWRAEAELDHSCEHGMTLRDLAKAWTEKCRHCFR